MYARRREEDSGRPDVTGNQQHVVANGRRLASDRDYSYDPTNTPIVSSTDAASPPPPSDRRARDRLPPPRPSLACDQKPSQPHTLVSGGYGVRAAAPVNDPGGEYGPQARLGFLAQLCDQPFVHPLSRDAHRVASGDHGDQRRLRTKSPLRQPVWKVASVRQERLPVFLRVPRALRIALQTASAPATHQHLDETGSARLHQIRARLTYPLGRPARQVDTRWCGHRDYLLARHFGRNSRSSDCYPTLRRHARRRGSVADCNGAPYIWRTCDGGRFS
ncbi:MAG: hypothetical protein QOJ72_802 [Nocardioidaceae bacterium]|nr:hypothetical protein [Nocardioidaceae bacterium]